MNIQGKINNIRRDAFIKMVKQAVNVRLDQARKQGVEPTLEAIIGDDMNDLEAIAIRKQFQVTDDEFKQIVQETINQYKDAGPLQQVAGVLKGEKIGRNSPCPCGSGKKYKRCCGG